MYFKCVFETLHNAFLFNFYMISIYFILKKRKITLLKQINMLTTLPSGKREGTLSVFLTTYIYVYIYIYIYIMLILLLWDLSTLCVMSHSVCHESLNIYLYIYRQRVIMVRKFTYLKNIFDSHLYEIIVYICIG